MKVFKYICSTILMTVLIFNSCKKDNPYENFPNPGYFSFTINPNGTEYQQLNVPGGHVMLTSVFPSNGILVYRISKTEFIAFEATCTYDPLERCQLTVEGSLVKDECCESTFYIADGNPFNGPAIYPLKKYRVHYNGNLLTISN